MKLKSQAAERSSGARQREAGRAPFALSLAVRLPLEVSGLVPKEVGA